MKTKIYYVMDTMCGWCYGFSDVITEIQEKYKDLYEFSILPGGMWTGANVKRMNSNLGSYIKNHNVKAEQLTGKIFGEGFNKNVLENTSIVLDSLPGAKALILIQKIKKEVAFSFLKKIQEAFFIEGKDMNSLEVYTEIAKSFNISKEMFEKEFLSEALTQETFEYFSMVASMDVASFPTVIAVKDNQGTILSQGYRSFNELDRAFASLTIV